MTDPDALARWVLPEGATEPQVEIDPHPGGEFRISMRTRTGEDVLLSGTFREVDAPRRLSYTYRRSERDGDDRQTVVDLILSPLGELTELIVDQGGFSCEARRSAQERGWCRSLDRLTELLER